MKLFSTFSGKILILLCMTFVFNSCKKSALEPTVALKTHCLLTLIERIDPVNGNSTDTLHYDSKDRLLKIIKTGASPSKTFYLYQNDSLSGTNSNNILYDSNNDNTIDYIETRTLNKNGKLLTFGLMVTSCSTCYDVIAYTYNSDGTLLKAVNSNLRKHFETSYLYDANKNLVKENYNYVDIYQSSKSYVKTYEYNAKNQLIKDTIAWDKEIDPEPIHIYEYNAEGKLSKTSIYSLDNVLKSYSTKEYDTRGNTISERSYDKDGKMTSSMTYKFTYDATEKIVKVEATDMKGNIFVTKNTYSCD